MFRIICVLCRYNINVLYKHLITYTVSYILYNTIHYTLSYTQYFQGLSNSNSARNARASQGRSTATVDRDHVRV